MKNKNYTGLIFELSQLQNYRLNIRFCNKLRWRIIRLLNEMTNILVVFNYTKNNVLCSHLHLASQINY